jgi:hypothetical protein
MPPRTPVRPLGDGRRPTPRGSAMARPAPVMCAQGPADEERP